MSTLPASYKYSLLRYIPDPTTQEFVVVGVVVYSEGQSWVSGRACGDPRRLLMLCPELEEAQQLQILHHLQSRFAAIPAPHTGGDFQSLLQRLIPTSENHQWSEPGAGISRDLRQTLDQIYERMIGRHLRKKEEPLPDLVARAQEVMRELEHRKEADFQAALIRPILLQVQELGIPEFKNPLEVELGGEEGPHTVIAKVFPAEGQEGQKEHVGEIRVVILVTKTDYEFKSTFKLNTSQLYYTWTIPCCVEEIQKLSFLIEKTEELEYRLGCLLQPPSWRGQTLWLPVQP